MAGTSKKAKGVNRPNKPGGGAVIRLSEPIGDELRHHNAIGELEELGEFGITSWHEFDITHALEVRNIDYTAQTVAAIRRHPRMLEMEERIRAVGWDLIWSIIDELGLMPPQAMNVQKDLAKAN